MRSSQPSKGIVVDVKEESEDCRRRSHDNNHIIEQRWQGTGTRVIHMCPQSQLQGFIIIVLSPSRAYKNTRGSEFDTHNELGALCRKLSLESTGGGAAAEDEEEIPVVGTTCAWLDIVEYVESGFLSLFYTVRRRKATRTGLA